MDWLTVVQALQRISQAGLSYSQGPFDLQRYTELRALAATIAAASLGTTIERVEGVLLADQGYVTPKVDVRAVVPRDGKLLFVREVTDGKWALPGGWADIGSSPREMAVREVFEETGYTVEPKKLLSVLEKSKHDHPPDVFSVYKLFIRCEIVGGTATTSHETLEVAFFGKDELPPLSTERNTEAQVRRMFEHMAQPGLPADFD